MRPSLSVAARAGGEGWRWPLPVADYDREPRLCSRELWALEAIARRRGGRWSPEVCTALDRLMRPLKDVLDYALELEPKRWVDVKRDFAL